MNDVAEAAGGLATGALIAKQFDHAAPVQDAAVEHGECLNCSAITAGRFCASCGQQTHLHRSMAHVLEEFLHGLLHFDGRAWRTLPKLAWNPGGLTRDYVFGKRNRYIAPLPLFLLSIFVMFFAFGLSGGAGTADAPIQIGNFKVNARDGVASPERVSTVAEADAAIARLDAEAARVASDPTRAQDAGPLRLLRSAFVARREALLAAAQGRSTQDVQAPWAAAVREATLRGDLDVGMPTPELTARVRHALLNPEFTVYKMQQKGYKLSFLLIPLSLPWMLLLFARRRDVRVYDHVIFLLYSQSFMVMLVILGVLLWRVGVSWNGIYNALLLLPLWHMYRQLKGAYRLSTVGALWRTAVLTAFAGFTLALYTALILALGLLD